MAQGFRIVIETYDMSSNVIDSKEVIKDFELTVPQHIAEVGLSHLEQIDVLQKTLDILVSNQSALIDETGNCPACGSAAKKAGKTSSKFHSVYTDHKVKIIRRICSCGWGNKPTIEGKFGHSCHPDLLKKQCEEGVEHSYVKAEEVLTRENGRKRKVNNHMHISRIIESVGGIMSNIKCAEPLNKAASAEIIVAQIDGGHIKPRDKTKRSFEALATKVYNPMNLIKKDESHNLLTKSTSVISALSDRGKTIKKQTLYAAKQEGMSDHTTTYVIADGAKNCWSAAKELDKYCKKIVSILDWCHIGRKFKNVEQKIPDELHEKLERAKWNLWHGDIDKCLDKLNDIIKNLPETSESEKIILLRGYLARNRNHTIDYATQKENNLPFTSSIIESGVDTLINQRQNQTKKMQWSREGAHYVLQIRASQASNTWDNDWKESLKILLAA